MYCECEQVPQGTFFTLLRILNPLKYALITGGSRGIGRACAVRLASMGYHILLNYRSNDEEAIQTQELVQSYGVQCDRLKADVSDTESIQTRIQNWMATHSDAVIEVLIHNAGIRKDNLLAFMQDSEWESVMRTNLDPYFYITRTVLNQMIANRFGRIIAIVSLSGVKGMPGQFNYSAAKAGMIGATKSLAQEIARKGVTVNAVAPGFISTDMTVDLDEKTLSAMVPMRRFGKPEEVAAAVGFLVSHDAGYITGEVIHVNGGLHT